MYVRVSVEVSARVSVKVSVKECSSGGWNYPPVEPSSTIVKQQHILLVPLPKKYDSASQSDRGVSLNYIYEDPLTDV